MGVWGFRGLGFRFRVCSFQGVGFRVAGLRFRWGGPSVGAAAWASMSQRVHVPKKLVTWDLGTSNQSTGFGEVYD